MSRVLVAGIGNVFLGDDGFGVEVARRLAGGPLPDGVEVLDVGIRGLHLAYRLLDGYELLIAVDAVARGGAPGTVYVLEPAPGEPAPARPDAHAIDLPSVLTTARALGAPEARVLVVGCEPAECVERMGLSDVVERAVEPAAQRVRELARSGGGTHGVQPQE